MHGQCVSCCMSDNCVETNPIIKKLFECLTELKTSVRNCENIVVDREIYQITSKNMLTQYFLYNLYKLYK